jgi:diadenosine tetraphosphate (Ap4A) HIT family hydrolase
MHLIPRYSDDNQNLVMKANEVSAEELDKIKDQIIG